MFQLKIDTDNTAFEGDPRSEVARILRVIAGRVEDWDGYDKFQNVLDVNGNDVGRWKLKRSRR